MLNTPVYKNPTPMPTVDIRGGRGNIKIFTIQGNADLNAIESGVGSLPSNEPSCKCAYCDTLHDHETGVCDRCGAPLGDG